VNENTSVTEVSEVLANIMHPEINYSLIDLGMIKDVDVKDNVVTLTLNVPFLEIPIKDFLINDIKEELKKINIDAKINIAQMSLEERTKFMEMSQSGWKL